MSQPTKIKRTLSQFNVLLSLSWQKWSLWIILVVLLDTFTIVQLNRLIQIHPEKVNMMRKMCEIQEHLKGPSPGIKNNILHINLDFMNTETILQN